MDQPTWKSSGDEHHDITYLGRTISVPKDKSLTITVDNFGKVELWVHKTALASVIQNDFGWTGSDCEDPIVIGTLDPSTVEDWRKMTTYYDDKGNVTLYVDTITPAETKIVSYFNTTVTVPCWTKFVAMDNHGNVYAFSSRPIFRDDHWAVTEVGGFLAIVGTCKSSFGIPVYKTLLDITK